MPLFPRHWGKPPLDIRDRREWIKRNVQQDTVRRGAAGVGSTADLKRMSKQRLASAYESALGVIESIGAS
jgi:hypothetical protein